MNGYAALQHTAMLFSGFRPQSGLRFGEPFAEQMAQERDCCLKLVAILWVGDAGGELVVNPDRLHAYRPALGDQRHPGRLFLYTAGQPGLYRQLIRLADRAG